MWTHPVTLLLLTALIGGIAYIVKMVLENNRIAYAVAETVKAVTDTMDRMQDEMKEIRSDLDELRGEHKMMINAGEMIAQHGAKKNLTRSSRK